MKMILEKIGPERKQGKNAGALATTPTVDLIPPKRIRYGLSITLPLEDLSSETFKSIPSPLHYTVENEKEIRILRLSEALKDTKLRQRITEAGAQNGPLKNTKNPSDNFFTLFHQSNTGDPLCIFVPDKFKSEQPITITVVAESSEICTIGSLLVFGGEKSTITLIEQHKNSESKNEERNIAKKNEETHIQNYVSHCVEIFAEPSANITHITVQEFNSETYNHNIRKAHLKEHATLQWIDCQLGGAVNLVEASTVLTGEHSSVQNYNLFFGEKKQRFDVLVKAIHAGRATTSNLLSRAALNDHSKAIYRGLVRIETSAPQSEGYQKADMLLLGEHAQADPIPELEINNHDVKCTHGATVGKVNEENLFYLMSRGLTQDEATRAIVEGFFAPIIDKVAVAELREHIKKILEARYDSKTRNNNTNKKKKEHESTPLTP